MRHKDEGGATTIVDFPSARMNGASPLDRDSALNAVSDLADQMRKGQWSEPLNVNAIVACLELAKIWLKQEPDLAAKLSKAHQAMGHVVRSNSEFEWLFESGGEPRMDLISPEVFEVLIELRVLADRLERVGVIE